MEPFHAFVYLIVITALLGTLNNLYLKFPPSIGVMSISLVVSLIFIIAGQFYPDAFERLCDQVDSFDFGGFVLGIVLSFLLFAGSFNINTEVLSKQRIPVIAFATLGVILSAFLIAGFAYWIFIITGLNVPFLYCLLFGALIAPTDPVAVLGIMESSGLESNLKVDVEGESLLNDGVAVVLFLTISAIASNTPEDHNNLFVDAAVLFLREAVGGALMGLSIGYFGSKLLSKIHDPKTFTLISLAFVMGGYRLSEVLHISGPLAMVVFGFYLSYKKSQGLFKLDIIRPVKIFWGILERILMVMLFLMIGIVVISIAHDFKSAYLYAGLLCIIAVLLSRFITVLIPIPMLTGKHASVLKTATVLTWGGLRGGISIALALSLNAEWNKEILVSVTYIVVVFSILVQGLTMKKMINWYKT